jgi:hypothetical protein
MHDLGTATNFPALGFNPDATLDDFEVFFADDDTEAPERFSRVRFLAPSKPVAQRSAPMQTFDS